MTIVTIRVFRRLRSPRFTAASALLAVACTTAALVMWPDNLLHRPGRWWGDVDGAFYWERVLQGWGFPVAQSDAHITFSWNGAHAPLYFRVRRSDADATYREAVRRHIETQIGYLPSLQASFILRSLTGEDHDTDAEAWRRWWAEHAAGYTPPPDARERSLSAIRDAYEVQHGTGGIVHQIAVDAPGQYRAFVRWWWIERALRVAAIVAAAVALMSWLARRATPTPGSGSRSSAAGPRA